MSIQAKHTPGPWNICASTPSLIEAAHHNVNDVTIAQAFEPQGSASLPEMWANARVIAAAPDLLAALQEVVEISDRKHDAWDKARAAIARARGEQS